MKKSVLETVEHKKMKLDLPLIETLCYTSPESWLNVTSSFCIYSALQPIC